jgi:choline kinase
MIGMVLAAGKGARLGELTEALPKTLLPVAGERTILDLTLANLRGAGIERVVIVTGFAAGRIEELVGELEERHDVKLELVFNDRAEEWNNAYSLWLARDYFAEGVLLVNGDTVHPAVVEERLLAARGPGVVLAVDAEKPLGEEEMKVQLQDGTPALRRINKAVDPAEAEGEYIGLTLIEAGAAEALAGALEATWRRDPSLYYEDGYQELVDRGGEVQVAPIGAVDWVEVDNLDDLARARDIACRY